MDDETTLILGRHTSQLIAHSLLPNVIGLLLALLFWRKALPYVLAFNAHLVADRMWNHTESFWWPLFGWNVFWEFKPMNTPETMLNVYLDIVTRYPQVWVVEIIAGFVLMWFIYRYQLYRWPVLKIFLVTGHIGVVESQSGLKSQSGGSRLLEDKKSLQMSQDA